MSKEITLTLKAARINANLSLDEAAKMVGLSKQTLIKYENFKTIPNVKVAQNLSSIYKLPLEHILFYQ